MEENHKSFLIKELSIRDDCANILRVTHLTIIKQIRVFEDFTGAFSIYIQMLLQNLSKTLFGNYSEILAVKKIEIIVIMSDVFFT